MRPCIFTLAVFIVLSGCSIKNEKANPELLTDPNLLHHNMHQLTEIIIQDIFSPPVSSRIYAYTSLAAYEAIRFDKRNYNSLVEKLKGFPPMPVPDKNKKYNYLLSATKAFFTVAEKITFSRDSLLKYENKV